MNIIFKFTIVVIIVSVTGCQPATKTTTTESSTKSGTHTHADGTTHADHGHVHEGPNDGAIADWGGGKYHVEFTVDHDKQQATVYVLDSSCKEFAPIAESSINLAINSPEFQIELAADPQEGDGDGLSSRFVGTHKDLGIVREFEGKIYGQIEGKPYTGDFKEIPHDH